MNNAYNPQPTRRLASGSADTMVASADLHALQIQLVADAAAAVLVLVVAATLALYKPRGMTPYGARKHREEGGLPHDDSAPRWVKVFGGIVIVLILVFVILHITAMALATTSQKGRAAWARPPG